MICLIEADPESTLLPSGYHWDRNNNVEPGWTFVNTASLSVDSTRKGKIRAGEDTTFVRTGQASVFREDEKHNKYFFNDHFSVKGSAQLYELLHLRLVLELFPDIHPLISHKHVKCKLGLENL